MGELNDLDEGGLLDELPRSRDFGEVSLNLGLRIPQVGMGSRDEFVGGRQ